MGRASGWLVLAALAVALGASSCSSDEAVFGSGSGGEGASSSGTGGATTSSGTGGSTTSGTGGSTSSGTGGDDCQAPLADCDGNAANGCETDTDSDLDHCGGCDELCSDNHALPSCAGGSCTLDCDPPFLDCDDDPSNGCETDTDSDLEHCGGCDLPCASSCELGACKVACDDALAIDVQAPLQALRAIGLCTGVQSASWVLSDGSPPPASDPQITNFHLGHGVLPDFGPNVHPQEGTRLLALSTGTARRPTDPGYSSPGGFSKQYPGLQPAGFPEPLPSCPNVTVGSPFDAAAIQLTLTPPPGATGFSFKSKYYAYDWDLYVCQQYADPFLALLSPAPPNQSNGNVVFDSLGNFMGPHSELIEVCGCQAGPPCPVGNLSFACPLGTDELTGTGFEQHGATGWLETRVPIDPDTPITLRFVIHDSTDGVLDSTVLLDDWQWGTSPGANPITTVVPNPL